MLNRKNGTFRIDNNLEGPRRSGFNAEMGALPNSKHEQIDGMFFYMFQYPLLRLPHFDETSRIAKLLRKLRHKPVKSLVKVPLEV
jgi:hypothetical protein